MKILRRIFLCGVILLFGIGLMDGLRLEASSLGPCEKAIVACFLDPGHNLPWDIIACLQGYDFCKRYVEPLLGR
jgi:hypothetical protein